MADRGMGIRLFRTKDDLQNIMESFDEDSDGESDGNSNATTIIASQLRHFVVQVSSQFIRRQMSHKTASLKGIYPKPSTLQSYE